MRKTAAALLGATVLAVPNVGAWAAATKATAKTKVVTATRSFSGTAAQASRWGDLQVTIVVRKTTTTNLTTKKKTVKRKLTAVKVPVYPDHTDRSVFINQQALPLPDPGGAAGAEHEHRPGLRRDRHELRVPGVAPGGDPEGAGLVAVSTAVSSGRVGVARVEHVMGMPIVVDVRDTADAAALDPLFDWFRSVDRRFSTYLEASEISRLNRGEIRLADLHPDVREVLARCDELRVETNGFFDVRARRDDVVDPSGLVKGWSVDRAAAIADELGWRNYALNAGGDIRLRGGALPAPVWRVGIRHPRDSSPGRRGRGGRRPRRRDVGRRTRAGEHVFDPHTHRPPEGVLSVTVTGPDLATADAYATAAFAMGLDGPAWSARLSRYEAMTILAGDTVLTTARFPRPSAKTA